MDEPVDENKAPRWGFMSGPWAVRIKIIVLALCLAAPSIWMLASVPPLWRDADAYNQVSASPARATAAGHGLLYCLVVRGPLYAGYVVERISGTTEPAKESFFRSPQLTDTGVSLLITAQHLALIAAALVLITSISRHAMIRVALAVFFASNPIFYTFAHCVGSETLSMICVLAFATFGLLAVRTPGVVTWRIWLAGGASLLAALLTRHANSLLILVLPLTFFVGALTGDARLKLRRALIALAIGLSCLLLARGAAHAVCATEGLRFYPKLGFTFIWRIGFLHRLPPLERSELLSRIERRTKTADGRTAVTVYRDLLAEDRPLHYQTVMDRMRNALAPPDVRVKARRVHEALNDVASAFLLPPSAEHWAAAHHDIAQAGNWTLVQISKFLFFTTSYYWDHAQRVPKWTKLVTFRDYTREQLLAIPAEKPYFGLWQRLSMKSVVFLATGAVLALALLGTLRRQEQLSISIYLFVLLLIGGSMIGLTALVGDLIPRYTLPLWEVSWIVLMVALAEFGKVRRARLGSQVKLPGGPSSLPPESATPPGSTRGAS